MKCYIISKLLATPQTIERKGFLRQIKENPLKRFSPGAKPISYRWHEICPPIEATELACATD
jgi:hypothetical protein